ncbi:DoxX family protein [Tropicimonas isoalkanivorans]|uniref:Putative oxidoreductase n=1 Tax=Tropicimonas isoalkanivorans TaxID=441112 RepID=A0A1I1N2F9_9RHOB|nr:DoxX family protein [Tropicimonas isoalkanivorans]SFC91854.1 putative oxidoreductase [Tropicimonas isoalkanivorans]
MADVFLPARERLFIPYMRKFYEIFAEPVGWAAFRAIIGISFMISGWPKIMAPFAQVGFLESIGLAPGWFFSPALAILQFVGGAMIVIGLYTRPIAVANTVMMLVTISFHLNHPYPELFLTTEGLSYLTANPDLLTDSAQRVLLSDGGIAFGERIQEKAIYTSVFWAAGTALIAAFGGGYLSVDRRMSKEF